MIKPEQHSAESKKSQVANMFNKIADSYDFLNHALSFGMDFYWRKKAISKLTNNPKRILDVGTGTADFAIAATKLEKAEIIGIDISEKMLEIGEKKVKSKGLQNKIQLQLADSENLPFENDCFDAITAGFGVRNFENLEKGLLEMNRVLKPGGQVVILETAVPQTLLSKIGYFLHTNILIPFLGLIIAKNSNAYKYLSKSAKNFPHGNKFKKILQDTGFEDIEIRSETFGVVNIYSGLKQINN